MASKVAPRRIPFDGSGYQGPLRYVEFSQNSKQNRDLWDDYQNLSAKVYDAAFMGHPWTDSHVQIAHYRQPLPWALKQRRDGQPEDPERISKLNEQPQLANFIIDIDNEDIVVAQAEANKVVNWYLSEAEIPPEALHISFSTSKGFHISLPWQLIGVTSQGVPSLNWLTYKSIAEKLAERLELRAVDHALFRRNGTIRLENTIHPKTGLFKVRITPEELEADIDQLREIAKEPRRDLYPDIDYGVLFEVPSPIMERLYKPAQAKADAKMAQARTGKLSKPLDDEIMAQLGGKLTPCLENIPKVVTPERDNNRNVTAFRASMMLNHLGRSQDEADAYLRDWLGYQYENVGAEATLESVYSSGFSGGCSWMRNNSFASTSECHGCPVYQKRTLKIEKNEDIKIELPQITGLPSIYDARPQLLEDLRTLNNFEAYAVRTPAGFGKTYATLQRAMEIVDQGNRVVVFVKDTKKVHGLASELKIELEALGFNGKVQTLYGRNLNPEGEDNTAPMNCDNWKTARNYQKKGYSVGAKLCTKCHFRDSCDYYAQYDMAYEPGIYIASHAMLPYLFGEDQRGFGSRHFYWSPDQIKKQVRAKARRNKAKDALAKHKIAKREGRDYEPELEKAQVKGGDLPTPIGGELDLIVIDEDALDSWLDEFVIRSYQLTRELKETKRAVRSYNAWTRKRDIEKTVTLDPNWLRVVEWLTTVAHRSDKPIIRTLAEKAKSEGTDIRAVLYGISPSRIVDPDYETNRGHRPFTKRLYMALMEDLDRLEEGNPVVMGEDGDVTIFSVQEIKFPFDVPVVILDAYARIDRYRAYLRRARIARKLNVLDYEVQEKPKVTYVLGAALSAGKVKAALGGQSNAVDRLTEIIEALKILTKDGVKTKVVAKGDLLRSDLLQDLIADSPQLVTEDEGGTLHWWRGRGINSAKGARIAIIQDPNPRPDAVRNEASVLFPDEPTLDEDRVAVPYEVAWAPTAPDPEQISVDRWDYADERLNMIQKAKREDELVQMAMRGRSITTGAEILVFSNYVDPRLPAERVYTLKGLVNGMVGKSEVRAALYEYIHEQNPGLLSVDFLAFAKVAKGGGKEHEGAKALRTKLKMNLGGYYFQLKRDPIDRELAEKEIAEFLEGETNDTGRDGVPAGEISGPVGAGPRAVEGSGQEIR